ncbi:hypothetical protein [Nannocystis pusilla]|uniref:hypothetical protein n=1 Tax=Nannocystis pusilla TaxID=889268 RepID=UPI003DA63065
MQPVPVSSAPPRLLDRPQRLGFLPTAWFWNDPERQRLVLPIVLSVTLPWMPVLFYLVMRGPLPFALFVVVNTLAPYLGMGLVERHIRRELRRRQLAGAELGELPVHAGPVPPSARRGYLALAVLGCAGSALAVGQLWGAFAAALGVLALTAVLAAAWRSPPPSRSLPCPVPSDHEGTPEATPRRHVYMSHRT